MSAIPDAERLRALVRDEIATAIRRIPRRAEQIDGGSVVMVALGHALAAVETGYARAEVELAGQPQGAQTARLRETFTALLRSHAWYTAREYQRDSAYNSSSRGYKEEEQALEALAILYPSYNDMLAAIAPDPEPGREGKEGG